jgi:TatD DNase family protein
MRLIDTHSHLYDEAYAGEEDLAVIRSVEAGVDRIIVPDIDSQTRDAMFTLTDRHSGTLFPCLGIHPTSVNGEWKKEMEMMEGYTGRKIHAVGEVGIDCYWSKDFVQEQKEVLRIMFNMAHEMNLPVIIHSRDAGDIILSILKECRHLDLRGVFHAFSGSIETYREIQKLGEWSVGIGGVLTFKKASIAETIKSIPLEKIILETDAPYLTPAPYRGTRNESSYIPLIAAKLAELQGISLEEVAEQTTANAEKLFAI